MGLANGRFRGLVEADRLRGIEMESRFERWARKDVWRKAYQVKEAKS